MSKEYQNEIESRLSIILNNIVISQKVCDKIGRMEKQTWFFTSGIDQGVTKIIASAVEGYR